MTARQWFAVFATISAAFVLGDLKGSFGTRDAVRRAEAAEVMVEQAYLLRDSLTVKVDSIAEVAIKTQADYTADSLNWANERERLRGDAVAVGIEARVVEARLRALGDSAVTAMVDELEALHAEEINTMHKQVFALEADRNALLFQRAELQAEIRSLTDLNIANQRIMDEQNAAINAWREAASPPLWGRVTGALPQVGVGLAAGVLVGLWATR